MSLVDATRSATRSRRLSPLLVFGVLGESCSSTSRSPSWCFSAEPDRFPSPRPSPRQRAGRRSGTRFSPPAPVATAIATVLGVPLAYVLARETFPGKRLIEALVVLPLVVPPVVGGAMLLSVVGRFTPIGAAATRVGVPLTDSLLGVVLAQTFVAAPFVVITARAGFGAVDERLEQASRSLGYGPLATFRRVSLPSRAERSSPASYSRFARAIGEFGATMMVAYNPRTMPTRIWVDFIAGGIDAIVPLALALLAITLVVVVTVQRFAGVPTVVER